METEKVAAVVSLESGVASSLLCFKQDSMLHGMVIRYTLLTEFVLEINHAQFMMERNNVNKSEKKVMKKECDLLRQFLLLESDNKCKQFILKI